MNAREISEKFSDMNCRKEEASDEASSDPLTAIVSGGFGRGQRTSRSPFGTPYFTILVPDRKVINCSGVMGLSFSTRVRP